MSSKFRESGILLNQCDEVVVMITQDVSIDGFLIIDVLRREHVSIWIRGTAVNGD